MRDRPTSLKLAPTRLSTSCTVRLKGGASLSNGPLGSWYRTLSPASGGWWLARRAALISCSLVCFSTSATSGAAYTSSGARDCSPMGSVVLL